MYKQIDLSKNLWPQPLNVPENLEFTQFNLKRCKLLICLFNLYKTWDLYWPEPLNLGATFTSTFLTTPFLSGNTSVTIHNLHSPDLQASLLLVPFLLPEKSWKVQLCPNFPELITHPLNQKEPGLHGSWLLVVKIFLLKWSCTDSARVSTKEERIGRQILGISFTVRLNSDWSFIDNIRHFSK